MPTYTPLARRTFRITIDIESTIDPASPDLTPHSLERSRYQQALVQSLRTHPEILRQLLRSYAVDALTSARRLFEAEYGWGRATDQQLLQPIIAELEPAAQAYFTEELEDGASAFYFEGDGATVMRFGMIALDEQTEDAELSSVR